LSNGDRFGASYGLNINPLFMKIKIGLFETVIQKRLLIIS